MIDDVIGIEQIYPPWHKLGCTNCIGHSSGNGAWLVALIDHLPRRSNGRFTRDFGIRSYRLPSWCIRRSLRFATGPFS